MDYLESIERRRRYIRIALFLVILGTLPFYCVGFLLWGTAGPRRSETVPTAWATSTPIGAGVATGQPSLTPLPRTTSTVVSPLRPTPLQFNPGGNVQPPVFIPTVFIQPTVFQPPVFIPTSTLAPTLTPYPTAAPPTATWTPLPTEPPLPTATTEPPPTDIPPPTQEQAPPTDQPPTDSGGTS